MAKEKSSAYKPGTFARFFKAVKGRSVTRFGTARYTGGSYREATTFGGHRPPMKPDLQNKAANSPLSARGCNPMEHDCQVVTAITHEEARRFRREYDRAVRGGDLVEVDEDAYADYLAADAEHAKKVLAKNPKIRAAMAKAEKIQAEQAAKLAKARTKKAGATRKASKRSKRTTPESAGGDDAGAGNGPPE